MIVQIVENGIVVNALVFPDDAVVTGGSVTWEGGEYTAPDGCSLMAQAGAGVGWTVSDGVLVAPPPVVVTIAGAALVAAIRAECRNRIFAVASQATQINIIGAAAAGGLDEDDMTAYRASVEWIAAMRAACAELVADEDDTFADAAHWPVCPPEVVALSARF